MPCWSHSVVFNFEIDMTSLTSLFILQPEDHRPMWYIHTITGEHINIGIINN